MNILGITGYFHDSSACLLADGDIVGYAEEERFNRQKHTSAYPAGAIDWLLAENGIGLDDLDEVVFYLNPAKYLKIGVSTALASFPRSLALARRGASTRSPFERLLRMRSLKSDMVRRHGGKGAFEMVFLDHYRTHQASAFFPTEFDEAAIVTMDFAVDGTTEVIAHGRGTRIDDLVKHRVPNGFALIYATLTHLLGFKWYDEYKVMGMAAYGTPRYVDRVEKLYTLDAETGALKLDLSYFEFHKRGMSQLFSRKMEELFWTPRRPDEPIGEREYDLAASLQEATNRYGLAMVRLARRLTGARALCLAGGVAQNCLMNQAICESDAFDDVFLQPLAGDVGGSIGGALWRYHAVHGRPRHYVMTDLYLGPSYAAESARAAEAAGLTARRSADWHADVARAIADGLVVGLFDGRMEAGPRALGARSILADPRRTDMKDILNSRVKHREHFRPFAPSVLAEKVDMVFEPLPRCRSLDFMIVTMTVRPEWRDKVPTISHADATSRVQTVRRDTAPNYHRIIEKFFEITGVPLVVNTSFNDNEPIVCRPEDAVACFQRTKIDLLVLDGRLYYRSDNVGAVREEVEAV